MREIGSLFGRGLGTQGVLENFTPWTAALGGMLIGVAAALLYIVVGRFAGISGIAGALLQRRSPWRLAFVVGLLSGAGLLLLLWPSAMTSQVSASWRTMAVAGLLVGYGTQLGGGCTSGHGVCGLSRLSLRSLVGTLTFMAVGAATVFIHLHLGGE